MERPGRQADDDENIPMEGATAPIDPAAEDPPLAREGVSEPVTDEPSDDAPDGGRG